MSGPQRSATIPGRGLFVIDKQHDDPAADTDWPAATTPPIVATFLETRVGPA